MKRRNFRIRFWLGPAVVGVAPTRRGIAALAVLVVAAASLLLALGAPEARAVITTPIPADVGPVPPPLPVLPAATDSAPPADAIADPVEPAAACGGWSRQDLYAGAWPAGSTWWEYRCQYAYPVCGPGACNADWVPSVWIDYFYWDGSKPVFYGEFYGDYYYGSNCDYWWDQPTARWYLFDTAVCPFSGPGNAAPTAGFSFSCSGLTCSFDERERPNRRDHRHPADRALHLQLHGAHLQLRRRRLLRPRRHDPAVPMVLRRRLRRTRH